MKKFVASILLILSFQLHAEIPVILQDASLKDFVTWYSDHTGESVIISPGAAANLTVYSPQTPKDSLPELFSAVIRSHGLELIDSDPKVISLPKPDPEPLDFEVEPEITTKDLVTRIYSFNHVLADDLQDFTSSFSRYQNDDYRFTRQSSVYVIRSTNALAITTTEQQHAIYSELLTHLDTPRPLIHLEAVIYEQTDSSGLDLGVAFGEQDTDGSLIGGFDLGSLDSIPGSGFTLGVLSGTDLSLVISALRSDLQSNILSTPQILVMSGEQGSISVGQNVPFLSSTTTSNGQTTQAIERKDVGVSLTVRPFISEQGQIVLSLNLTADSINQSLQASDIITNTRNLSTTVQIQSGDTISLGGLITTEEQEHVKRVPVLGSIPILGTLFRSTSIETTERELNIILRAVDPMNSVPAL